ncbi:Photosystem I assembly protein Ycf3 [bacterium HR37]|nr:Photosystem I assembly protein Ycf3 [bacterium HR37]
MVIGRRLLVALFVFSLSFCVFIPSLKSEFVWDDIEYIEKTSHRLSLSNIPEVFFKNIERERLSHYRPFLFISFVADKELWGMSPFGFHLTSVILYAVSSLLFYLFSLFLLGEFNVRRREEIALLSSFLFALYPVHVESVSFVSARADILCTIFFLPAFLFHVLSHRNPLFLIPSALFFFFSLLSKEIAISFPLLVLAFDLISRRFNKRSNILRYGVYLLLVLAYFYLRGGVSTTVPESVFSSGTEKALSKTGFDLFRVIKALFLSYLFYIGKLVFPYDLNPFIATVPDGTFLLLFSVFLVSVLFLLCFLSVVKGENIFALLVLWISITLAPSLYPAVFPVAATPLAERFLFLPSSGYALLVGYLFFRLEDALGLKRLGFALGLVLCVSYAVTTVRGQSIWKSSLSLWERAVNKAPGYVYTHGNYGLALMYAGRIEEALKEFQFALTPEAKGNKASKAVVANSLGLLYASKKKNLDMAEEWFLKSISYNPRFYRSYYNLAIVYFMRATSTRSPLYYKKAEEYLRKAMEVNSSYGNAYLLLAKVYIALGRREEALDSARKALEKGLPEPMEKEARRIVNALLYGPPGF